MRVLVNGAHGRQANQVRGVITPRKTNGAMRVFGLFLLACAGFCGQLTAAEIWVDINAAPGGNGSETAPFQQISQAVVGRVAGDVIKVRPGTYNHFSLATLLAANRAITIESTDGADATTIVGNATNRGATLMNGVNDPRNAILRGFTVRGGSALTRGPPGDDYAGGVWGGTIYDCIVSNNTAWVGGGVSHAIVYNSTIAKNHATNGGGGVNFSEVYDSLITGNTAAANGGGVWGGSMQATLKEIRNCTIANNTADQGGGVYTAFVYNSIITNNTATSRGGGVCAGTMGIGSATGSLIINNKVTSSTGLGGGTYGVPVHWSTITGNTAPNGAGAYNGSIYNCHIIGNTATVNGGGYYENVNNLVIENSVIARNTAAQGAGVWARGTAGTNLRTFNCTIVYNTTKGAGTDGGAFRGTHFNGILYGNLNSGNNPADNSGGVVTTSRVGQDPLFLDAPGNNFRLQPTSPCIDYSTANLPTMTQDLDGNPRVFDYTGLGGSPRIDQGAYESFKPTIPPDGVLFHGNGGVVEGLASVVKLAADGHYVLPEAPTRANYTFIGWYAESAPFQGIKEQITQDTPFTPTSAQEVFAHWILSSKGGNGAVFFYADEDAVLADDDYASVVLDYGDKYEFPTANPTKANHAFTGWFDVETGLSVTTNWVFSPATPKQLVAHWEYTGGNGGGDAKLLLTITAIKISKDGGGNDQVTISVKAAEGTEDSDLPFIISLIGTADLNLPFTANIPTYDPPTMDEPSTPTLMKTQGCSFTLHLADPEKYFFRAIATPAP